MKTKELKQSRLFLRQRLADLVSQYGKRGEKHPTGRLIGGLNPAAQEIRSVRGELFEIKKELDKDKPKIILFPIIKGLKSTSRNLPQGLLFDAYVENLKCGQVAKYKIGKDNTGRFYLVTEDRFVSDGFETIGKAKKAIMNNLLLDKDKYYEK